MNTIIKKITHTPSDRDTFALAGDILRGGGLVAFPTETVYGLGADALNEKAAEKIYTAKGRPSDNPLIIHIADMDALPRVVKSIPEAAKKAAAKYWPGPLTMIFEKADIVPFGTTGGLTTVAVRMPENAVAQEMIRAGGGYIAAPSANTSGRPSPTTAKHVAQDLSGRIDMLIDDGEVPIGVESTILDLTVEPPMILRPGAVTKEMLAEVLGDVRMDHALMNVKAEEAPKAPGMKYRHYAPKAALTIVEGEPADVVDTINGFVKQAAEEGKRTGVIATAETAGAYEGAVVRCVGSREDEAEVAAHLFSVLRAFDEETVDAIYSEAFSSTGIGTAVMNRLLKAAGHHVISAVRKIKEDE